MRTTTLAPVRPSAAIEIAYRKRLDRMLQAMHRSICWWVTAGYRQNTPEISRLAHDASPARALVAAIRQLRRRWERQFNQLSNDLATWFATEQANRSDTALRLALRRGGFTVKFKMTRTMNDAYQAVIAENVGLIKSIPQQYLSQVEGMVMRSVQVGGDLGTLAKGLQDQFGVTKRRAALISRDQNAKATAVLTRVRHQELGIVRAQWVHSGGGKTPRPTHVKASRDGVIYEIAEGWTDPATGRKIWPGTEINCIPGRSVLEFSAGCKKLWRRRYAGELTHLITASGKTLEATPNHPVLTGRGWVAIQAVNVGDYLFKISDEILDRIKHNVKRDVPTFAQAFDTTAYYCPPYTGTAAGGFHGDSADGEIDTIDIDRFLPNEVDAAFCKEFAEVFFTDAGHLIIGAGMFEGDGALDAACRRLFGPPEGVVSGLSSLLPFLKCRERCADDVRLGLIARLNACLDKATTYHTSVDGIFQRESKLARTGMVFGDDDIIGELLCIAGRASAHWYGNAPSAEVLGNQIRVNRNSFFYLPKGMPIAEERDCIVDKRNVSFSGHVFNLETWSGYYSANSYITQNCRCVSRPIMPVAATELPASKKAA